MPNSSPGPTREWLREAVLARSRDVGGCWEWKLSCAGRGYGQLRRLDWRMSAHRASYTGFVGPIPDGYVIDHLCRNPQCVNPQHLEAVTQQVNVLRGNSRSVIVSRRGRCKRGHPRDADHLNRRGQCRLCQNFTRREKAREQRSP